MFFTIDKRDAEEGSRRVPLLVVPERDRMVKGLNIGRFIKSLGQQGMVAGTHPSKFVSDSTPLWTPEKKKKFGSPFCLYVNVTESWKFKKIIFSDMLLHGLCRYGNMTTCIYRYIINIYLYVKNKHGFILIVVDGLRWSMTSWYCVLWQCLVFTTVRWKCIRWVSVCNCNLLYNFVDN